MAVKGVFFLNGNWDGVLTDWWRSQICFSIGDIVYGSFVFMYVSGWWSLLTCLV